MKLMIINGSVGGKCGNSSNLIDVFRTLPESVDIEFSVFHLANMVAPAREDLSQHDAFLFVTGTYWDSWGSPLQTFLENSTPLEGDACWLGKPCGVITTMHSVGGKDVSNRLQGVLNSFGLFVPPMSAMAYSLVSRLAMKQLNVRDGDFADDFWSLDDMRVVASNLKLAVKSTSQTRFHSWPVDRADVKRIWLDDVPT